MENKQINREAPEGFDQSWLACRAPYDAAARSRQLESLALGSIVPDHNAIVMDLGCGSGNNVRFLADRWPQIDHWIGVDHDPELIRAANDECNRAGIAFTGVVADLLDLDQILQTHQPDLVVGNAVFDLFTRDMMGSVLEELARTNTPMLTTLLYTSMKWEKSLDHEAEIINLYEAHMVRQRPSGTGLGPHAPQVIEQYVNKLGGTVINEESIWKIPGEDRAMQEHLLRFMGNSVPEMMNANTIQNPVFDHWMKQKLSQLSMLTVTHKDMWITWQ